MCGACDWFGNYYGPHTYGPGCMAVQHEPRKTVPAEQESKPSDYTNLFTMHADCQLARRDGQKS